MPKVSTPNQTTVLIDSLSKKGKGISRGSKLEIHGALPGEEVLVEKAGRRKAYLRDVLTPSSDRVEPRCPHAALCGGCSIQQMDYFAQLDLKEKIVSELFAKYDLEIAPIIGMEDPWRYRNKMEFSFSEDLSRQKYLGLFMAGSRGRVVNVDTCLLTSEWFSETLTTVRNWWEKSDLKAYHHRSDTGHLRTLTLRESKKTSSKMVMLTVSGNPDFAVKKSFLKELVQMLGPSDDLSIFLQVHQIAKGRPTQFFEMLLSGPDHITEKLEVELHGKLHSLVCKISPTSFFQPNLIQAEKLYSAALEMIPSLEKKRVLDLYCGSGTIGLTLAKFVKEVIGIELNPHAVFDARWNIEVNKIENVTILQGDVSEILEKGDFAPPDLVIVDPPRAGLGEKALKEILKLNPQEILYISCNPKTQVEDVDELTKQGYRPRKIQPVDQFPHTMHIENICYLVSD